MDYNVIEYYYLIFGILTICQYLFLVSDGYYLSNNKTYYFCPPFNLIKPLSYIYHNILLTSLFILGFLIILKIEPLSLWFALVCLILLYLVFFCYSSWHHDIYLMMLLSGLTAGLALPNENISQAFSFLIKFQVSSMYFFAAIAKCNYINSNKVIFQNLILYPRIKELAITNNIWRISIGFGVIITESILCIIFWIPNIFVTYIGAIIGIVFHLSTIIFIGRGRLFHATLPSIYLLFIFEHDNFNQLNIFLIIFGIISCYFFIMKYVILVLLKKILPIRFYNKILFIKKIIKNYLTKFTN